MRLPPVEPPHLITDPWVLEIEELNPDPPLSHRVSVKLFGNIRRVDDYADVDELDHDANLESHAGEHPLHLLQLRGMRAHLVTLPVGDRGERAASHVVSSSEIFNPSSQKC